MFLPFRKSVVLFLDKIMVFNIFKGAGYEKENLCGICFLDDTFHL